MKTKATILREQMSALAAEVARLEALPKEPALTDTNVVYFEKRFKGSTTFNYAAVKADDGRWYVTGGRAPQRLTWERLVEWIASDEDETPTIWLAVHMDELA